VHKINPAIHLMCELHVTVKLCRGACSLYDADSYFSGYPLEMWTACNSEIMQRSMHLVWCWLIFFRISTWNMNCM